MNVKRLIALIAIVAVVFAGMAWTTPYLLGKVRLGLDLKGGFEILYEAQPIEEGQKMTKEVLRSAARSIEKRANTNGAEEPEVTPEGTNRIRAKIAGVTDQNKIRKILKEPANLTFRDMTGTVRLHGDDFKENAAKVEFDGQTGAPIISIRLKDKSQFYQVTKEISQMSDNRLGIYLDETLLTAPSVNFPIDSDKAIITGYSLKEAKEYASVINLGALPVKLTEKYTQVVDATLGQKSLDQTMYASVLGFAIILLFMLLYYRVPGIIACFTLLGFAWLLILLFTWMNVTITLPGIAAFVLGIGMAVDANIITYERIKEEIRSGKSIASSVRAGSRHSFRAILDANLTTIIAGVALYYFGHGSIKGFALVLIISNIVSMFTNVFISRVLLHALVKTNAIKKVSYFGVKEGEVHAL